MNSSGESCFSHCLCTSAKPKRVNVFQLLFLPFLMICLDVDDPLVTSMYCKIFMNFRFGVIEVLKAREVSKLKLITVPHPVLYLRFDIPMEVCLVNTEATKVNTFS